jgi:DNA primase
VDELYSSGQIEAILNDIGVDVKGETNTNLLCLCPFHKNRDSPSFSVAKDTGLYLCFTPGCDERGTLPKLVAAMTKANPYVVKRLIKTHEKPGLPISQQVEDLLSKNNNIPEFSMDTMNMLMDDLWSSKGEKYLVEKRKLTTQTLAYFGLGYSIKNDLVTIPLHDWNGKLVGIIGRSTEGKKFKNSDKLPTSKTLFNVHRAKKLAGPLVIVEASMDAMRIHQAGHHKVVATNGGFFTEYHKQLIERYFDEIIIMTDDDDPEEHRNVLCRKCSNTCLGHNPGRALGEKIVKDLPNKKIRWASYSHHVIFPNGAKDPGALEDDEIMTCINNSISSIEWNFWKKEVPRYALI